LSRRDRVREYLQKRADLTTRLLISGPCHGVDQVVVVPVLAEGERLFEALRSLAANPGPELQRTLVICVVNHRVAPFGNPAHIDDNRRTLTLLEALRRGQDVPELADLVQSGLRLGYVDAASPGYEFPEKGGVGLARKIGLDWGLAVLDRTDASTKLLFSLDADATVEPNYLSAVREYFEQRNAWAGVVSYAHPLGGPPDQVAGIVCYELFLRYHVLGLRYAQSPYAFPSIGSTMICRSEAYVAVSGMNQRQAGEDFYFLQQLAKTRGVTRITTTTVYPSSRPSDRVPFGTGPRVRRFMEGGADEYLVYDPRCYRILKHWLAFIATHLDDDADQVLSGASDICIPLGRFLEALGFPQAWSRLRRNSKDDRQFHDQFHRWFDGFRTLKLIHYLRDNGFPQQDLFESIRLLLEWIGAPYGGFDPGAVRGDVRVQIALLYHLRNEAAAPSTGTKDEG